MEPDTGTAEWRLSGFGDEIDPDPGVQCAVLRAVGASHIEVRSSWGTNIVDLDDSAVHELGHVIAAAGLGVSAIASPVGKSELERPLSYEIARLDRAIAAAHTLGAGFIRVFSFWQVIGESPESMHDQVVDRLRTLTDRAAAAGLVLVHENEKGIYGDTPRRVLDLVRAVDMPSLRLAWDNANFVQVGSRPFSDGFADLSPFIAYFQIKDARASDGVVVAPGEGDGELPETINGLRDLGFTGFASLEPHLLEGFELGGFSGPSNFGRAARAFRALADAAGVTLT